MMILDYTNFILARPGYNEKFKREVSWDELKNTFSIYKRIPMIVAGGNHSGPIDPNDAVGYVDAEINDKTQIVHGVPTFFKNRFEDVPAEIQQRLAHKQHVHASLGYEPFQNLRKMDHVAIGVNNPVFENIGFNAESTFWYESTDGINKDEPTETDEPKEVKFVSIEEFTQFKEELFAELRGQKEETPPETTEKVEVTADVIETEENEVPAPVEEQTVVQPKPQVEPERVIKREQPQEETIDGMFTLEGGKVFSTPIGKPLKKK